MKIEYKDLKIEIKKGEKVPDEFLHIIVLIENTIVEVQDMIRRGIIKINL